MAALHNLSRTRQARFCFDCCCAVLCPSPRSRFTAAQRSGPTLTAVCSTPAEVSRLLLQLNPFRVDIALVVEEYRASQADRQTDRVFCLSTKLDQ